MSAFYKCTGDTMTTQLNAIEACESTIGHIFSDEYAFEIPPYQRPYAWEQEQVEELLSDLLDAMDNGSDGSVYFLGSIVLIKSPNQPPAKVVDGQQRLTTLTMMLSVLRDLSTDPEVKIVRRNYVYQKANRTAARRIAFGYCSDNEIRVSSRSISKTPTQRKPFRIPTRLREASRISLGTAGICGPSSRAYQKLAATRSSRFLSSAVIWWLLPFQRRRRRGASLPS
jgi:Protein of unknown function DUF262